MTDRRFRLELAHPFDARALDCRCDDFSRHRHSQQPIQALQLSMRVREQVLVPDESE